MTEIAAPVPRRRKASPAPRTGARYQAKLTVGAVNDRHEQEADRLATAMTSPTPQRASLQRPPPAISGVAVRRMPATIPTGPEHDEELDTPEARGGAPAQRKAESAVSDAGGSVPASVERSINSMRSGSGSPLDATTRSSFEGHLGRDISAVRVHTGGGAAAAATALHARAFTVGNDIFFARGQYQPGTSQGRRLLAHEVTHTIQQSGGSAHAQRVQRDPDDGSPPEEKPLTWEDETSGVGVDIESKTITVAKLGLPPIEGHLKGTEPVPLWSAVAAGRREVPQKGQPFTLKKRSKRPAHNQRSAWQRFAREQWARSIKRALQAHISRQDESPAPVTTRNDEPYYYLNLEQGSSAGAPVGSILTGTTEDLASHPDLLLPNWGRESGRRLAKGRGYHVDHILEYQTGGALGARNTWLLQGSYNTSVGSRLKTYMSTEIDDVLRAAREHVDEDKLPATSQAARRKWTVKFKDVVQDAQAPRSPTNYWTKSDIRTGAHLQHLQALTGDQLETFGLRFSPGVTPRFHNVFASNQSSWYAKFPVTSGAIQKPIDNAFSGLSIESIDQTTYRVPVADGQGQLVTLEVGLSERRRGRVIDGTENKTFPVRIMQDTALLGFGGYLNTTDINRGLRNFKFKGMSPIRFSPVAFDSNGVLMAEGHVLSEKALLPGLAVPIRLHGNTVQMDFPLDAEQLNFGPLSIFDPTLSLGVNDNGFFVAGTAGIALAHVGTGEVRAVAQRDNVTIGGTFNLDVNFLESAEVAVLYSLTNDELSGSAELHVKQGTLPGVKSGVIRVGMTREAVSIDGTLDLSGPLDGSTLDVTYDPNSGLLIAANNIALPVTNLPGVENATVSMAATRDPETGEWRVGGSGQANLAAGGATGTFTIAIDGDAVQMRALANVAKGPASGFLLVQASNLPRDDEGNLIPDGEVGPMRVWGKGGASITFGEILTGTAILEYTEDGRVILVGDIALPPNFKVFEGWSQERSLVQFATPEFPIWGVSVAGFGVGIFASADTEISFDASLGPAWLRNAHVTATMDLDRPAEATVSGSALFEIPATAGLTLDVGGLLTARATIAYIQGRIGLEGRLGIDASAGAEVQVDWNQRDGLAVGALLKASATPKFTIGANASVTVGISIPGPDPSKTWGPWRKQLGEFGSGLALELEAPVAWSEANGLEFDLADLMPPRPSFDTQSMMDNGLDAVKS